MSKYAPEGQAMSEPAVMGTITYTAAQVEHIAHVARASALVGAFLATCAVAFLQMMHASWVDARKRGARRE